MDRVELRPAMWARNAWGRHRNGRVCEAMASLLKVNASVITKKLVITLASLPTLDKVAGGISVL